MSQAIQWAKAETGEVAAILAASTFRPGAPAFTTLIKTCGRAGQWEKALELYAAMKARGASLCEQRRDAECSALFTAKCFFHRKPPTLPQLIGGRYESTTPHFISAAP